MFDPMCGSEYAPSQALQTHQPKLRNCLRMARRDLVNWNIKHQERVGSLREQGGHSFGARTLRCIAAVKNTTIS